MAEPPPEPVNVLSLDGGGIRGLSSLLILDQTIEQMTTDLDLDDPPLPCDVFDLICGTSTGGLIAIMLGRLRMSVKDCIAAYVELAGEIFKEKKSFAFGRKLAGAAMYDHTVLVEKVKGIVEKHGAKGKDGKVVTKMADPLRAKCCKTFVAATTQSYADAPARLFRTYAGKVRADQCEIWEAARATSAAPTFFDPIEIGRPAETYIDGALGMHNNPSNIALNEAKAIWPDRPIGLHLSIGTGVLPVIKVTGNAMDILTACQRLVASCQATHDNVYSHYRMEFSKNPEKNPYHRFSVDRGLENMALDEWQKLNELSAITTGYLRGPEREDEVDNVVEVMKVRGKAAEERREEEAQTSLV